MAEVVALDEMVGAYFGEYADPEQGIPFSRFCHLLSNCRLFATGFDHSHALEVFKQAAVGVDGIGASNTLDSHALRRALQGIANMRYETLRRQNWEKLEKLLNEMSLKREVGFDSLAVGEKQGLLYDMELIPVVYRYVGPLRALFTNYATSSAGYPDALATWASLSKDAKDPLAVCGRSAYKLCRATQLVPCCAVPRELLDFAASFQQVGDIKAYDRRMYFQDEKMLQDDQQDWNYPARGKMEGEPRYSFPELVELLVTIALCMPPRVHQDTTAEKAKRIVEVFDKHLGAVMPESFEPDAATDDSSSKATDISPSSGPATARGTAVRWARLRSLTFEQHQLTSMRSKMDVPDIFEKLRELLPELPEPQEWKVPKPSAPSVLWSDVVQPPSTQEFVAAKKEVAATLAAAAKKAQERYLGHAGSYRRSSTNRRTSAGIGTRYGKPSVAEEWTEKRQLMLGELLEHGEVPSLVPPPLELQEALKPTTKKGKKVERKLPKPKPWGEEGIVPINKVCFYAQRPVPPQPTVPPQYDRERRSDMLALMESQLEEQKRKASQLAGPVTGWVLRMALICEPLLAPRCAESEEVSTLIETALTSRRLRNYDVAISMLIRARSLWARHAAGQEVQAAWAEMELHTVTESPWEHRDAWGDTEQASQSPSPHTGDRCTAAVDDHIREKQSPPLDGTESSNLVAADGQRSRPGHAPARPARAQTPMTEDAEGLDRTIHPLDLKRDAAQSPATLPGVQACAEESSATPDGVTPLDLTRIRPPDGPRPASARPATSATQGRNLGLTAERCYDPQEHFSQACGDDDENLRHLKSEVNIFFLCELAALHCAIQEDGRAAHLYWRAKIYSEMLPDIHPDRAVVWCGFGRVAFHAKQFDLAARSFSRARRIRERTIGEDTVETATTYNNLACCLIELSRPMEAAAYLELAAEILKVLVGEDHPRAQTALRNLEKAKTADKHLQCEVPPIFGIPVQDLNKTARPGSKRRRKKRRQAGSRKASPSLSPRRSKRSPGRSPR